jgi:hypothetical protein
MSEPLSDLFPVCACLCSTQIYVIDSADRRRMEETGVELQQLLDEVRSHSATCNKRFLWRAISREGLRCCGCESLRLLD